jgi:hypothetical protein
MPRIPNTPEANLRRAWMLMIQRCYDESYPTFHRYGQRGITVCDRWRNSFALFSKDMGPKPTPKHTVGRIDNDGPYHPNNCRWETMEQQTRNRCTNINITHNGKTQCLQDWCAELGISYSTAYKRISRGVDHVTALTAPVRAAGDRPWRNRLPSESAPACQEPAPDRTHCSA